MNLIIPLLTLGTIALVTSAVAEAGGAKPLITLTTKSGRTYEKSRVTSTDPDGIRIVHADGAAKIPFSELSQEQREEYGFDADKAAAYKLQQDKRASEDLANEVKLQKIQLAEEEAAYFRALHLNILSSIQSMAYDYAKLDAIILEAIEKFRTAGKKDWVKILEDDRDTLKQRELQRPAIEAAQKSKQLEAQNLKLQQQIDQLKNQQVAADNTRKLTYYSDPFSTSYYYNQPVYVQQPIVIRPPVCPTPIHPPVCPTPIRPAPVPMPANGTGAGGYVPPSMQGGLDGHGGYTPPNLRR
jgi:hypothetical protein